MAASQPSPLGARLTLAISVATIFAAVPFVAMAAASAGQPTGSTAFPTNVVPAALDTAVLAGGCFWGMELVFEHVKGVKSVVSGYAGGRGGSPSYAKVSSGRTGHAEAIRIIYDPSRLSYPDILRIFFSAAHDPTQKDRQGPDIGTQYRSAIFFSNPAQERDAREYIRQLTASKYFQRPIVTEVAPAGEFHEAEAYHQDYALNHPDQPYIVINDVPRLAELKTKLPQFYANERAP